MVKIPGYSSTRWHVPIIPFARLAHLGQRSHPASIGSGAIRCAGLPAERGERHLPGTGPLGGGQEVAKSPGSKGVGERSPRVHQDGTPIDDQM